MGPDNGIFSFVNLDDIENVFKIKTELENISNTFHGRDIFAPAAAKIASKYNILEFARPITIEHTFTFSNYNTTKQYKIIYIDEFGNRIATGKIQ